MEKNKVTDWGTNLVYRQKALLVLINPGTLTIRRFDEQG